MHRFSSIVWTVVKLGLLAALIPTLIFFLTQALPAALTTNTFGWAK